MTTLRKLGRATDHRKAMMRNQVTSLFEHGKIETTLPKAKETQRVAEKMITLAKKGDLHARRQALAYIYDVKVATELEDEKEMKVVEKLFSEIGPSYEDRNGGYTRVLKLGPRRGDAAEMAILELV